VQAILGRALHQRPRGRQAEVTGQLCRVAGWVGQTSSTSRFTGTSPHQTTREPFVVVSIYSADGATSLLLSDGVVAAQERLELHRNGWADSLGRLHVVVDGASSSELERSEGLALPGRR
jgi:hypothetical protein